MLDLGCGTAALLPRLARWSASFREYAGADTTPEMLAAGRAKLVRRAGLVAADAHALPFADVAFDTVISASSLHYWPEPAAALAEVRRVLAPAGRLLLVDWCGEGPAMRALVAYLRLTGDQLHHVYSLAEATDLLRSAGFRIVRQERHAIGFPWRLMVFEAAAA